MNDRAASETVGFVLAFVLVTATIGAVYATGIEGLHDAQRFEQVNNAERAFDVLADNVADVHREGVPSRATELRLGGATLDYRDPVTIRVQVNETGPSTRNATYVMNTNPLVYSGVEDSELVYVGGAVFRSSNGGSVMRREPGYVFDDERVVIPFLITYPRGDTDSISGDSTVLIVAYHQSAALDGQFRTGSTADVRTNVTVESPRAVAWKRYFERKGLTAIDGDATDGSVTYQLVTDRVVVPETVVEFELKR
ncbi:DUF7289 family protein [Haladaptatus caseinilyticus]|uniref:DUF7289 family protein n=1 Tax=Haladaptatus caseinilyticus TaxID=2993314 RepID=UPI00224B5740|nr:hypothetical protein [Haladaptatus caseinilyticus]